MKKIFGWHAVLAALENENNLFKKVILAKGRKEDSRKKRLQQLVQDRHIFMQMVSKDEMDQEWGAHHQGVAGVLEQDAVEHLYTENDLQNLIEQQAGPCLILILDGIQDPHNLGACLRSADAAGVCCVIAPKDKSAGLTPAVKKVACGAAETVPFIAVTNLARCLRELQSYGVWIYGASHEAEQTLYAAKFPKKTALVMGAEEKGLRRLTAEHCDELIKIPMYGSVESLNVSVATGICLFEIRRQQN